MHDALSYYRKNRNNRLFKVLIYVIPFILVYCLSIGKLFFQANGPINATDLEVPLNPKYYFWGLLYPYVPFGLGGNSLPNLIEFIYGFIAFFSFGNELISQIILFSLRPIIAYTGTLLLTRKTLGTSPEGSVFASIFYAFSPAYLAWFSLPYQLSMVFVPWLFFVGINASDYIFSLDACILKIKCLKYSLVLAILLSLITSLYFHIIPLTLLTLGISSVFILKAKSPKNLKKILLRSILFIILTGCIFLLITPRIFQILPILTDSQRQATILRTESAHQILDLINTYYEEATLSNILRLTGGTPFNERFIFLNSNILGFFLPILVFAGVALLEEKAIKHYFSKKTIYLYASFIIISISLIAIALFFRELAASNNLFATNFLFSVIRRPERLLEHLTLFYALGMAFSFSAIGNLIQLSGSKERLIEINQKGEHLHLRKVRNSSINFLKRIVNHNQIHIVLLIVFLFLYIAYSGLYLDSYHEAYAQQWVSKPKHFDEVESFLKSDYSEASKYDSEYRYLILPSYVQMDAYTRYNYPNFFYYGGFSSNEVANFVTATNELITEKEAAAIIPLSLASVKHIAILPENFAQDELQKWRLAGDIRTSGVHLFGDITQYYDFISGLTETSLLSKQNLSVFVNQKAIPRIYVPRYLVQTQEDLKDVFKDLTTLNNIINLDEFAFIINPKIEEKRSFYIEDFAAQKQLKLQIFNATELDFKLNINHENRTLSENNIIVWSDQKLVAADENLISVCGDIPSDKQYLSIWVSIPPTNLNNTSKIETRIILDNELIENLSCSILDSEGVPLPAKIKKTASPISDDEVSIDLEVSFSTMLPSFLKLVLNSDSDSTQEIILQNIVRFEEVVGLQLDLNNIEINTIPSDLVSFPLLINRNQNQTILWPQKEENLQIEYSIDCPVNLDEALLFVISTNSTETGWSVTKEMIDWKSPTEIVIDLDLSLTGENEKNQFLLPIFFGNEYDASWKIVPITDSCRVIETDHILGNGFGNLWLLRISEISKTETSLHLSFSIHLDQNDLALYQLYMITGFTTVLSVVPLSLFFDNNIKSRLKRHPKGVVNPDSFAR